MMHYCFLVPKETHPLYRNLLAEQYTLINGWAERIWAYDEMAERCTGQGPYPIILLQFLNSLPQDYVVIKK